MNSKRAMSQLLKHLTALGVTHLPKVEVQVQVQVRRAAGEVSRPVSAAADVSSAAAAAARRPGKPAGGSGAAAVVQPLRRIPGLEAAEGGGGVRRPEALPEVQRLLAGPLAGAGERQEAACALAQLVAGCRRCGELADRRTQTVFGAGSVTAEIMFIGEAPGQDEDEQGVPFVGAAGQLLDKIIGACRLRREDLYICNVLRCRPPGNRTPTPQEAANCREFLDAQIQIVRPKYIVCWGAVAAQNLLGVTTPISKLRGQLFEYQGAVVLATYHPSYLLRTPAAKKDVWEDMKLLMRQRGVELS
ncbi:MAG: uracil-DNA glycosylase [Planctomycetaceae bacterium]